jgi:hypothetical protein
LWEQVFFAGDQESWRLLEPRSLLANTTYEVMVGQAAVGRFTTGSSVDVVPPSFDGLGTAAGFVFPDSDNGTCRRAGEPLQRIELGYDDGGADIALRLLRVRRPGDITFFEVPLATRPAGTPYSSGRVLENTACSPRAPVLEAGVTYCASVVAFDAAGNAAGHDVERCFIATTCLPDDGEGFTPMCQRISPTGGGGCGAAGGGSGLALAWLLLLIVRSARR